MARSPHLCRFLAALVLAVPATTAVADESPLQIEINPEGFGASKADILAVCTSAGEPLLKRMPNLEPTKVAVSKGAHGPISLFARGKEGEYQVKLDTGQTYWAQYAYQFAHELCHVLCRYDDDYKGNLWFEETLCELASLYCLREMSVTWRTDPPYPNWKSFAPALRDYTDTISRERADYLEILRTGMPAYFRRHAAHLTSHPTDRDKNGAMALALLALFERQPDHWNAIRWINSSPSPEGETFRQYLSKWRDAVPARHREFVESIAALFGEELNG